MEINLILIAIFLTIFAFDSTLSSDIEDYKQMKKIIEDLNEELKSLIRERLTEVSKVHKLTKRNVPDFRNVLIEAQNRLNQRLLNGHRRIKKFKIQRRSDDSNENQSPLQESESIQHQNIYPLFRDTMNGPDINGFRGIKAQNNLYQNKVENRMKRNENIDEEMRDTAEEYDEPIPINRNVKIDKPIQNINERPPVPTRNNDKYINYPKLMSEFTHTINHEGKGYHRSYFIPNIEKISKSEQKDRTESNSKLNDYWKEETEAKIIKNPIKSETSVHKSLNGYNNKPEVYKTSVRSPQQIRYSPRIVTNSYNGHSYSPFDQPLINTQSVVYGRPLSNELNSNALFKREPVFQSVPYRLRHYSIRDKIQRPNAQYRRQPLYKNDSSTERPSANPPIHWTKVVAELNDQKNRINEDRPLKSRHSAKDSVRLSNDRYFKVGATLDMH